MTPAAVLLLMLSLPNPLTDCDWRADAGLPECAEYVEPEETE